ncbi:Pesticidal crystal protein like [Actinidia chinensis var. chinensis]|uniref:Pesticidal crystal protein like n=1 Tax=Actinidia chinensis var. chinensis TaxID=1590841 RepID=A0A2R6PIF9_ACTCC|nr:Pesticidal crystal protein like [Actinidia chinensis var. chinensis]
MSSTPKKRPKTDPINPRRRTKATNNPSHSSYSSHSLLVEPPPDLFPSRSEFLRLVAVVAIAASVAVACNYVVTFLNSQPKPFCDSDTDFDFSDYCEPCPSNGKCYDGKLECIHGYKKHGKLCLEDGDINETAKKLSELIETRVCEAYTQFLCEGTGAVWIEKGKLWNDLDEQMENHGLDSPIYEYAKQKATDMVDELLETRTNIQGIEELKCPDLLVEHYKPFTCYIRQWIAKRALILVPLCALLIGSTWLLLRIRRRNYLSTRAEQLYNQVCDILEEHALISRSSGGEGDPWVVASWLRDHLLLPKERKDHTLWKKVEELVQEDSRLDRYPKLVKGESKVVWEWQVEGSLSSSRKIKKAVESKLKSNEGTSKSSNQQFRGLKAGQLLNS